MASLARCAVLAGLAVATCVVSALSGCGDDGAVTAATAAQQGPIGRRRRGPPVVAGVTSIAA